MKQLTDNQIRYIKYKASYIAYRKNHRNHHKKMCLVSVDRLRFGGLREQILKRDDYKCVDCGMTSKDHKREFGRELTIDHVDGNGRYSKKPNNNINNLITKCVRCHMKKEWKERWFSRRKKLVD